MPEKKKYLQTHPWLSFSLDMADCPYLLWVLLGAAESKCKHLAGIPLRPEKQDELNVISLRKGVQATTAIEGNSLSLEEIDRIIEGRADSFPPSKEYQKKEVENVTKKFNDIATEVNLTECCKADFEALMQDNAAILNGLHEKDDIVPGAIRSHSVVVGNYLAPPAEDCEYLLQRLFQWLDLDWGFDKDHKMIEGILKAIMSHLYIAWIHPFGDGNGRSARMLEFRRLMISGIPLNASHLLTSHYNDTRTEYYRALAETSRTQNGNPIAFLLYAVQGFVDALDAQIKFILKEQLNETWQNYIHDTEFKGTLSTAQQRQRDLLLELSNFDEPVQVSGLRKRLSDTLLERYEEKTTKTFNRDINELERRNLLVKLSSWIYVAKWRMQAFLPLCAQSAKPMELLQQAGRANREEGK